MEPSQWNCRRVLESPPSVLADVIPRVCEKLRNPDVSKEFADTYMSALKSKWIDLQEKICAGWDQLQAAFVDSGYVETVIILTQNQRDDIAITTSTALDTLMYLSKAGTPPERRRIFNEMIRYDFLKVCLDKAENHELCLHRSTAIGLLRSISCDLFLGETLTPAETSELIETLCRLVLAGDRRVCEELLDPSKTWQSKMMLGREGINPQMASRYGKRWFAMTQENCLFAVHALLCRSPPPSKQYYLEICQHKPSIIDQLLSCAALPRPPWYPEWQVDALACEALAVLFHFPLGCVPGLEIPLEGTVNQELNAEYNANIAALKIFVSRSNWMLTLIEIWLRIDKETYSHIKRMFDRVPQDYYAVIVADADTFQQTYEYRGQIRVSILRLIASATYVEDIKDAELISLLRPTYAASQEVHQVDGRSSLDEVYTFVQRNEEICRSPVWALESNTVVDAPEQIPNEMIMGPIALIRILTCLSQRKLLDKIQTWTALPEGTAPSTILPQLKIITSHGEVKRVLSLALKQVTERRERGRSRLSQGDPYWARAAYIPAAELANVLAMFDEATNAKWQSSIRGARKELVLNLGNAAEMSMRAKVREYEKAVCLALAADALGSAARREGLPEEVIVKNKRRLAEARRRVQE